MKIECQRCGVTTEYRGVIREIVEVRCPVCKSLARVVQVPAALKTVLPDARGVKP